MKKVLLASTAVAAFLALSNSAVAQDPGRADFGATEGGGGAGSAFTLKTNGAVKFYIKYSGPNPDASRPTNAGVFTLTNVELEFNGAATTDNGIDIETHVDLDFSGQPTNARTQIGGTDQQINIGDVVRADEVSLKISGGFGSVELGNNDGAEDAKIYGGSVAAGTGGIDGDLHGVSNVTGFGGAGGQAGSGDSGDSTKVTYRTPVFAGVQLGASLAYETVGPDDSNGGTLGYGFGANYSGKGGGVSYGVALVYGDQTAAVQEFADAGDYGGLGLGGKFSISGFSAAAGITIDRLGIEAPGENSLAFSAGVAYAIPDTGANVSLTGGASNLLDTENTGFAVFASADYAVLPGVTLATDIGYSDDNVNPDSTSSYNGGAIQWLLRVKAAF